MTATQQRLLDEAIDMWERGFRIPIDLFSRMTQEGLDVLALEEIHFKDN